MFNRVFHFLTMEWVLCLRIVWPLSLCTFGLCKHAEAHPQEGKLLSNQGTSTSVWNNNEAESQPLC
jgi:hypothetical protein